MLRHIHSLLFWGFLLFSSILLFPIAVLIWAVTSPFDRRKRLLHLFTCFWASLYTWTNPAWPVVVVNRAKLVCDRPTVMVANHLSLLDILVLFRLFSHFKWVSKVENFRVPLIGWNMRLNGYVKLTRGNKLSIIQMMRSCERALAQGNSIMMFPEGTRSPTGRMRRFKPGAFELAQKTRTPIQPLMIRGTSDALPKAGFVLQGRHPISLTILDPIEPEVFEDFSTDQLTEYVRDIIAEEIARSDSPEAPATRDAPSHDSSRAASAATASDVSASESADDTSAVASEPAA